MIVNEGIGGGKKLPALTTPGVAANLLSGKQLIDQNGAIVTGTMTNRGNVSQSLNAGGSYTIPSGYHAGGGKVTANSLSSQTSATATAADIRSGKTAWVNGSRITGTGQMAGEVVEFGFLVEDTPAGLIAVGTDQDSTLFDSRGANTLKSTLGGIVVVATETDQDYLRIGSDFTRLSASNSQTLCVDVYQLTGTNGILRVYTE